MPTRSRSLRASRLETTVRARVIKEMTAALKQLPEHERHFRRHAKLIYPDDGIQVDPDAETQIKARGAWVAAWLWVPG